MDTKIQLLTAGPAIERASSAIVMIHGRGASASSILSLYPQLDVPHIAAVAPQAPGHTWYPYSFLEPLEANQPYLDRALATVTAVVDDLIARGISAERIAVLGFSQGACLTLEFAARNPRRYGAILALTGGLIGPEGTPRDYPGNFEGTPVFIGTSDPDAHVPFARVEESRDVLTRMGAKVEVRRYPGMPHTINEDEINACRTLLEPLNISR